MADDINSIIVALDRHINSGEAPPSSVYIPEQSESNVDADEPDEQSSSPTPSSPSGESNLDTSSSSAGATATTTNSAPIGAPDSTKENGSPNPARRIKHVAFLSQESTESSRSRAKEEPLDQESLLIAATLIQDAKEGRNLVYILSEKTVRAYIVYNNKWLRWLLYFTIFLVLALALFEEPAVTGLGLPYWGTMLMEFPCLVYFAVRMCHAMSFQQRDVFFKDAKNITIIVVLLLSFLDMMCYIIWENLAKSGHPIRWSRFLRPLFIINFPDGKQIRRAFRNIRRTVPDIMNVLILFLLSVLLFGLLALKLFYRRDIHYPDGTSYFSNYLDAIWDLYVLVTTANNPDVMMPAYNRNNWFAIFFIVYIILCLYIFMSIVLAAIYNNYRKNLKNEIKSAVLMKRQRLGKAFDLLKVRRGDEDVISHSRWRQLTSVLLPTKSEVYSDLMMKILDDDNTSVLSKKNFLNVSDLLNVHLSEVKDRITLQEKLFPKIYNHPWSVNFKFMVRHKFFRYIFDFMIGVNALFIAIDLDVADWFFLSIFTFEILCNLYVAGFKEYFQRFWYTFDFLIIGSAFCASVIERIMGRTDDELRTLDVLLVLRVLRLVKIFGSIKRFKVILQTLLNIGTSIITFKVILQTLLNIGTSIITYGGVIFVFFYSFAIIGMELFSGLISYYGYDAESQASAATAFCGNAKLNNSLFYSFHYCGNNFNNILKALMVMFELMVVNQWHDILFVCLFIS
ncbi:two pore calcium channel protein 1 [Plakobranchus ocellatus]|uniref:Two pore calcium channel protein 1 n=1 Tax=Plakobranchus ocellatus TaxID=259542 RepID=A0AAV4AUF3_9GAST|nr:two pore calcium channel protein 1 [Plakobranchus ocellatus]